MFNIGQFAIRAEERPKGSFTLHRMYGAADVAVLTLPLTAEIESCSISAEFFAVRRHGADLYGFSDPLNFSPKI